MEAVMIAGSDKRQALRAPSFTALTINSQANSIEASSRTLPSRVTSRDLYPLLSQDIVLAVELGLQKKLLEYTIAVVEASLL